jgi:3-deoxy-D-manno-octulosonate 8-phosphate phosphatase (KDO 8-P phosphatase)
MNWSAAARRIKAIILDIDGVMTDGMVGFGPEGNIKFFNARDGHAIKMALREGLLVGALSGRDDPVNRRRADELGLSFCYTGEKDKLAAFQRLLAEHHLQPDECLYVGDDVVDIPIFRRVGVAVAVSDAVPEAQAHAHVVTAAGGGRGAVREIIVRVLTEQGRWAKALARYVETGE